MSQHLHMLVPVDLSPSVKKKCIYIYNDDNNNMYKSRAAPERIVSAGGDKYEKINWNRKKAGTPR